MKQSAWVDRPGVLLCSLGINSFGDAFLGKRYQRRDFGPQLQGNGYKMRASQGRAQPMEQDRRRSPRFTFIADAEVRDQNGDSQLSARISDISATGCYVDTINPLPDGTAVRVRIFNEEQSFEAAATVAYSLMNLGMGLSFGEVTPSSRDVLQQWLH